MNIKISQRDATETEITLRDIFACFIMAKPDTTPEQAYGLADMMIDVRRQY